MARRSANGLPQPKQRPDGQWYVFLELGRLDGKRKRKAIYGKTKAEVVKKLRDAQQQQSTGADLTSRQTVQQYLERWLEQTVTHTTSPETLVVYRQRVRDYIVPAIGHLQLRKLEVEHVEQLQTALLTRLAPNTVLQTRGILVTALNKALKSGHVQRNVAALVDAPRVPKATQTILTIEQVNQLLAVLADHPWEALYRALITLGWRKNEMLGLRWVDIDFDAQTISLTGALKRRDSKLIRDNPKTEATIRTMVLPSNLADAFSRRWSIQQREFAKAKKTWTPQDYVFTTRTGKPISQSQAVNTFKVMLKRASLPNMRLHDLRHSCAVLLVSQNEHPATIRDILGHTDIRITMNRYARKVVPTLTQNAISKLDTLLHSTDEADK